MAKTVLETRFSLEIHEHLDKNSGKTYYYNAETKQSLWTKPPDMMSGGAPGTSGTAVTEPALTPAAVSLLSHRLLCQQQAAAVPALTPAAVPALRKQINYEEQLLQWCQQQAAAVPAITPAAVPALTAASSPPAAAAGHVASAAAAAPVHRGAAAGGAAAAVAAAGMPTTGNGMTAPQASSKRSSRIVSFVSLNSTIMV